MQNTLILSRAGGRCAAALLCALLTACATTQRSSTSDAARLGATPTQQAAAPESAPAPSAAPTEPSASTAPASTPAARADTGSAEQFPPDANATSNQQAEAARAKQQLAEQDAAIQQLREQQSAANHMPAAQEQPTEAAPQAAAAPAQQSAQQPESARQSVPVATLHNEEPAVQFPQNPQTRPQSPAAVARNEPPPAAQPSEVTEPTDRSVYFNYDEATVLARFDAMLLANAAYLSAHPEQKIEVQGNCDERGSREYNLALGARRAEAVKRALELGGVASDRIHAISFGAEKPIAMGHDENSWSQNRRADIVDK